jgi:hypothetical protein
VGAVEGTRSGRGDGLELLAVQAATRFELDESGRILREHAPDLGVAPRLWFAGSADGNALRLRHDLADDLARTAAALVEAEPPLAAADAVPSCLGELASLLEGEPERGVTYVFPTGPPELPETELIHSDTGDGEKLLGRGLPPEFATLGFRDEDRLWPPWCVASDGGRPVAIAFSARLSPVGVEAGVFTVPAARGRGLAAAAAAGWAASPALATRVRFYSTTATNVSSQRVAERLGLDLVGPSFEIR